MFRSARLKLTAWYLAIIMALSIIFSMVIYRGITSEIRRSIHIEQERIFHIEHPYLIPLHPFLVTPFDQQLYNEATDRIRLILVGINISIFIFAGAAGYFLAGRTLKPIQNMVDEQNRFITDASHELRTPLTSLKSEIEVYMRGQHHTVKEADRLLASNLEEVNSLQILSDNLIQLAQNHNPYSNNILSQVSIIEVLTFAVKKVHIAAKHKAIVIETKVKDYTLLADKGSLVQLFCIFIENAVKYSPEKSIITITSKYTDHSVVVYIKDRGIGIDKKDIPHIFDRFYRADTSRTKQSTPGYGLGLSIAKKIVKTYQGTIGIKSEPGKGTTFSIQLPNLKTNQ